MTQNNDTTRGLAESTLLAFLKILPTLLANTTSIMFSNRYFFGFYYFTPPA